MADEEVAAAQEEVTQLNEDLFDEHETEDIKKFRDDVIGGADAVTNAARSHWGIDPPKEEWEEWEELANMPMPGETGPRSSILQ